MSTLIRRIPIVAVLCCAVSTMAFRPAPASQVNYGDQAAHYSYTLIVTVADVDLDGGGQTVYVRVAEKAPDGTDYTTFAAARAAGKAAAIAVGQRGVWDTQRDVFYPGSRVVRVHLSIQASQA